MWISRRLLAAAWTAPVLTSLVLLGAACSVSQPGVAAAPASVATTLAPASPESVGMSSAGLEKLRDAMKKQVDDGKFAGISVLVARHGKVASFDTYGFADVATGKTLTNDSIYRIASMSKPVTGVAMMMLYEEGKWQLDDPVAKHVPELEKLQVRREDGTLEPMARPMTMRQLMSHSAGFAYGLSANTPVDKMYRDAGLLSPDRPLSSMIEELAKLPLAYQPGTRWQYSISVDVQGYIVEKLSGQRFDDFLRARLFGPLGMKDTDFAVAPSAKERAARIHAVNPGTGKLRVAPIGDRDPTRRPAQLSGGGGLVSTTQDYARFCQMVLNGGELGGVRILKPSSIALMASDQLPQDVAMGGFATQLDSKMRFGLDFAVMVEPPSPYGKNTHWWGGAFGTWFWIDPTNDLFVVGMVQHVGGGSALSGAGQLRRTSAELTYEALTDPAR